jgi:hypothetical protein
LSLKICLTLNTHRYYPGQSFVGLTRRTDFFASYFLLYIESFKLMKRAFFLNLCCRYFLWDCAINRHDRLKLVHHYYQSHWPHSKVGIGSQAPFSLQSRLFRLNTLAQDDGQHCGHSQSSRLLYVIPKEIYYWFCGQI